MRHLISAVLLAVVLTTLCLPTDGKVAPDRIKRQSDSATEVVGLAIDADASDGDYKTLKRGARSVSRPKRHAQFGGGTPGGFLSNIPKPSAKLPSEIKATPPNSSTDSPRSQGILEKIRSRLQSALNPQEQATDIAQRAGNEASKATGNNTLTKQLFTITQLFFQQLSYDYKLAQAFDQYVQAQNSTVLTNMVVVKEGGVTCSDVCKPGGTNFGTRGICTPRYCTCDFPNKVFTPKECEKEELVFDPHTLSCRAASETILCSADDDSDSDSSGE